MKNELKNTIWSEENDYVQGLKSEFDNEQDFVLNATKQYKDFDGKKCVISNLKVEACISTARGVPGDALMPLSMTDVEIANYYTADVSELEEGEPPCECEDCETPLTLEKYKNNDGYCDTCLADRQE
jgi:hypothetical protein